MRTITTITRWYGLSEYHRDAQWFIRGMDLDKMKIRDFAEKDILVIIDD